MGGTPKRVMQCFQAKINSFNRFGAPKIYERSPYMHNCIDLGLYNFWLFNFNYHAQKWACLKMGHAMLLDQNEWLQSIPCPQKT